MKVSIEQNDNRTYRQLKLNCEAHSSYEYLGDLSDEELKKFLLEVKTDIDVDKNMQLLKYYGYLHLFVIKKAKS